MTPSEDGDNPEQRRGILARRYLNRIAEGTLRARSEILMAPLPVVAWLGESPPAELAAELFPLARIIPGWTPGAAVVCAWAPSGTSVLGPLGGVRPRPPVLAVTAGPFTVRDRLSWIRAGADDLLPRGSLRETLIRTLFPDGKLPEVEVGLRPAPPGLGAFPPIQFPEGPPLDGAEAWCESLRPYLRQRDALTLGTGAEGLSAFLAAAAIRERVALPGIASTDIDFFGARSGLSPGLDWRSAARYAEDPSPEAEIWEATVQRAGRDGLTLELPMALSPGQRLMLDLPLDAEHNAQLLVECRWQRRLGARRWQVGALVLKARRRPLGD